LEVFTQPKKKHAEAEWGRKNNGYQGRGKQRSSYAGSVLGDLKRRNVLFATRGGKKEQSTREVTKIFQ